MFDAELLHLSEKTLNACRLKGLSVAVAESCTGGLIGAALSAIPGSSDVFERGFVTYANRAKTEMLGVSSGVIQKEGAVSETVARAMAEGALAHSPAQISTAVTGIAGPGGGTPEKPVGLVHIASARIGFDTRQRRFVFEGDRHRVRLAAVRAALNMILELAQSTRQ